MRIDEIPINELVDDYYASLMDKMTCERLDAVHFEERIAGNTKIMAVIRAELERRGKLDLIESTE